MSIAPHYGIIDFGEFTPPSGGVDGIQGEVPAPLASEAGYILSTAGWIAPPAGTGTVTSIDVSGGATGLTFTGGPVTTSGTITAGGTLGILIPPSVMLIVMGPVVGVPATDLFAAAVIPGLMLSGLFIAWCLVRCWINPALGPALPMELRPK